MHLGFMNMCSTHSLFIHGLEISILNCQWVMVEADSDVPIWVVHGRMIPSHCVSHCCTTYCRQRIGTVKIVDIILNSFPLSLR